MPTNKNALIRYKTIDKCLQNDKRKWTIDDIVNACSAALTEYEGSDANISKRSIQHDIYIMRSDKIGYNAPIVVYDKKYYKYDDPNFSITNIPITKSDINVLTETVEILKQFKDFSLFSELRGIIQRLEDIVYTERTKQPAIIHLENNTKLKGLKHLDFLYQAILKQIVIEIEYKSFRAKKVSTFTIHPYILKEYNNRWFILGKEHKKDTFINLALDRIIDLDYNLSINCEKDPNFSADEYYKNTIGSTVQNNNNIVDVLLKFDLQNTPYVATKPLHHSQQKVETLKDAVVFKIHVQLNFELERKILAYGDAVEVLAPSFLRNRIAVKAKRMAEKYQ